MPKVDRLSRARVLPSVVATSRVAAGYMLETPSIWWYSPVSHPLRRVVGMGSDNPSSAVNQQERPDLEEWAVGFVDGEGCFSISVVRHRGLRLGWQVQHGFPVTQNESSRAALELLVGLFGCGTIIENHRKDDHREVLCRYSVKSRSDLINVILPFFREHPLRTAKRSDFERFASVVRAMEQGEHLTEVGLRDIARTTGQMNRRQRSRYLESSEAIRQLSHHRR